MNTEIYMEMTLFFDNDFDVYEIGKILGMEPTECKRQEETRMSPFDKTKHLEGYWTLRSETFREWDIKPVIDNMIFKIKDKIESIKELCEKNNGEVHFEIVPKFKPDNLPAIYFEREFLHIVHQLDATIDIDMYCESENFREEL